MASKAREFPLTTKQETQHDICGIATDIVCTQFAGNRVFVIVSQCGNIGGTIIEAKHDRAENKASNEDQFAWATTASVKTLLGARNDPLTHVYASHLLDVVGEALGSGVGAELVLSLALKNLGEDQDEKEGDRLRAVADAVKALLVQ
ncbi:UNVERIFIED_CONTAM: Proteasome assembly chaperone 3 [Siphonaria sp. JEL0065]|nr:Proteasome assembly chaperone 3 [Siphonaria sp. JEL0065]